MSSQAPSLPSKIPHPFFAHGRTDRTYNHRYPLRFGHFWNRHLDQRSQGLRFALLFCFYLFLGMSSATMAILLRKDGVLGCCFCSFLCFNLWNPNLLLRSKFFLF